MRAELTLVRGRRRRDRDGAGPGSTSCIALMQNLDGRHNGGVDTQRLDVWLWVARLAKTRSLANEAVAGGRVQVDGQRTKPSRSVRVGDTVEVTTGPAPRTVVIRGLQPRRGPASEAQLLYEETPESVAARERVQAERRLQAAPQPVQGGGRPTKRDRRRLDRQRGR